MNEKQVEIIIEHLESIAISLAEIAGNQPAYNQDNPIHIVDSTSEYWDRRNRTKQIAQERYDEEQYQIRLEEKRKG